MLGNSTKQQPLDSPLPLFVSSLTSMILTPLLAKCSTTSSPLTEKGRLPMNAMYLRLFPLGSIACPPVVSSSPPLSELLCSEVSTFPADKVPGLLLCLVEVSVCPIDDECTVMSLPIDGWFLDLFPGSVLREERAREDLKPDLLAPGEETSACSSSN